MAEISYAYANTRVKCMESRLLPKQTLQELLAVKTVNEAVALLEEGPYKDAFVEASIHYSGRALLLNALFLDFSHTIQKLMNIAPHKSIAVKAVLRKWEVQAIQFILANKALGEPVKPEELIFFDPVRLKKFENFINAPTMEAAVNELAKTEYGPAIAKARNEYEKTKDFRVLVSSLDKFYYAKLSSILSIVDNVYAKRILRAEMTVHNVMLALRMKRSVERKGALQQANEDVESHFIQGGDLAFASQLARAKDYDSALKMLEEKYDLTQAVNDARKANALTPIEIALDRRFTENAAKAAQVSSLSFGSIIGYLYLKQREIKIVRAITFATELGLADDMKKMVFETGGLGTI